MKRLASCASKLVLPSGFCRFETFDEDLSVAIFRDLSLGNAWPACAGRLGLSLGISAWELPFNIVRFEARNFCLGSFAWKLSLDSFRLGSFVWELSLWNFRFGTFALERVLRSVRFEALAWELSVWGTFAWELSLWELQFGIFGFDLFA